MTQPLISTIVLNWNRADLLLNTLTSYKKTISVAYELFIVDNGSTDNSPALIKDFCAHTPNAQAILLANNLGGEAINLGLERARGQFLHISENDLEYLPRWADKFLDLFAHFPQLGQLSLFGPLPPDEAVGGVDTVPPSRLRHAYGRMIYEVDNNVGTACVMRRDIWDRGIRVHSLPERNGVIFPDDGRLSREIKELGYLVARADHWFIKNIGHTVQELKQRPEYYAKSYQAKPWVGEVGLQNKLAKWEKSVKPRTRESFLFTQEIEQREKMVAHPRCPEPHLWSMFDEWTPEIETLEFLYALTRLVKPKICVATDSWRGFTAEAIGRALQQNGRGKLWSLEKNAEIYTVANQRIIDSQLTENVEIRLTDNLSLILDEQIDLLLLNGDVGNRIETFQHFVVQLRANALVILFDVHRSPMNEELPKILAMNRLNLLYLPTPRGLVVAQLCT